MGKRPLLQVGFPPELSLEPADVEQLYDAMLSTLPTASDCSDSGEWQAGTAARLEALSPERFFAGGSPFLSRQQVRQYEAALKGELLSWARASEPGGRASAAAALAAIRQQFQPPPEHDALLAVRAS